ncbi:MAG: peroxiredoxin [Deltaproteobacteria bacterium]|nr:peroxiredoxin [Deltaproteobacteria bacterium]
MRRWEELRPELNNREVQLVTLCTDTPKQIRAGMGKHGARAMMLSDRDLAVTRQYGLENTARMVKPPGITGLPIPTTILVDREGAVRWIDQSADYQVRSQPDRVLAALEAALE